MRSTIRISCCSKLGFQPLLDLGEERSGVFGSGGDHAVNHDFVSIGHVRHLPEAFVWLRKEGQPLKAVEQSLLQLLKFSAATGLPSLK